MESPNRSLECIAITPLGLMHVHPSYRQIYYSHKDHFFLFGVQDVTDMQSATMDML